MDYSFLRNDFFEAVLEELDEILQYLGGGNDGVSIGPDNGETE